MSEIPITPDPSDQSRPDPVRPETSFMLAKSMQLLISEVEPHIDPEVFIDLRNRDISGFDYESRNKFFGSLEDWDGRFFSFKQHARNSSDQQLILRMSLNPDDIDSPPDAISYMQYKLLGEGNEGDIYNRTVVFCAEGPALVQDDTWGMPTLVGRESNKTPWRPMTQPEAEDLLTDFANLNARLEEYISAHPTAMFYTSADYEQQ